MACEKKNMTTDSCRVYIQWAQRPDEGLKYSGVSENDIYVQGTTMNIKGDKTRLFAPDPLKRGKYVNRGSINAVPDLHEATLLMSPKCGGLPRMLVEGDKKFNIFVPCNCCGPLGDHLTSWKEGYGLLYSGVDIQSHDLGDLTAKESAEHEFSTSVMIDDIVPIASVVLGGVTNLTKETSAVCFGQVNSDGSCEAPDDGTKKIYWATLGDVAAKPGVVWTADGGTTRTTTSIAAAANAEATFGIAWVNGRIVVIGASAHYWADIDTNTGAPGTFSKVTSGYAAAPNAIVSDGSNTFICGASGTVWTTTDVTVGVTAATTGLVAGALAAIDMCGNTSVAVGASGAILATSNAWQSAKVVTPPAALSSSSLVSVQVKSNYEWWITASTGERAYTLDGGSTWSTPVAFAALAANSIVWVNDSVGWMSTGTSIYSTWTVGASWTKATPRISSTPAAVTKINQIAYPKAADGKRAANVIAVAGLATSTGIALVGLPTFS